MKKGKLFLHTITVPALTAGTMKLYDAEITLRNLRLFSPFRSMHVTNANANSVNVEIMFDYNSTRKIVCMANGIKDIKDQPFNAFSIKNLHALTSLTAGEVVIELETY